MRVSEDEDDKAARVKALEEMMKLQQIDESTFIKLRDEILGGDVSSTHLVKGLDFKLLERVKRGEDVLGGKREEESAEEQAAPDVDDEFEKLEDKEIVAIAKDKAAKKGEMAPPTLVPGKKRNRDQILAELKASRQAAKEAAQPALGSKFKRVGAPRSTTRIESDSRGREVLITVDEHGNTKRKVRKAQPEHEKGHGLLMPDKDAKPLGMEVPEIPIQPEIEEEVDIFDDAGDDYDPLAGLDEEEEEEKEEGITQNGKGRPEAEEGELTTGETKPDQPKPGSMAPPTKPAGPRDYFGETKKDPPKADKAPDVFSDPVYLAALKKAATLNPISQAAENGEEAAKAVKRRKMLQQDDRDAMDIDMGFGSSKFADEEDFEEKKVKLSEWGKDGGDEGGGKGEGKGKRKRGPKKRKGDGNNAADVMKVLERRKAAGS